MVGNPRPLFFIPIFIHTAYSSIRIYQTVTQCCGWYSKFNAARTEYCGGFENPTRMQTRLWASQGMVELLLLLLFCHCCCYCCCCFYYYLQHYKFHDVISFLQHSKCDWLIPHLVNTCVTITCVPVKHQMLLSLRRCSHVFSLVAFWGKYEKQVTLQICFKSALILWTWCVKVRPITMCLLLLERLHILTPEQPVLRISYNQRQ